jgi:very-short-patch-repair endonuclease
MDPVRVLHQHGGHAPAGVLVATCGRRALAAAVSAGTVLRVRRGRYALPFVDGDLRLARALGGAVCDVSAAVAWGLESLHPADAVHVAVGSHAMRRSVPQTVVLHFRDLTDRELRRGLVSVERTVVDCARRVPFADALAVADSALRRQLSSSSELEACATACTGRSALRARRVVAMADSRAANPFESALRAIAIDAGLTNFVPQVAVQTPEGTFVVDLGDPDLRLAVEAESFEFHGARRLLTKDARRTNSLSLAGWVVLRFSWEQVMFEPEYVARVLRAAVARLRGAGVPKARTATG